MEQPTKEQPSLPVNQTLSPPKTNFWMIISLILLTVIIVGSGVYFWLTTQAKKVTAPPAQIQPSPTSQTEQPLTSTVPPISQPAGADYPLEPKFISVDEIWNKYDDPIAGFSLKVPKQMLEPYANCPYVTTNDHSYRPKEGLVPVQFFLDNGVVFLAAQYIYRLGGETMEGGRNYFSKCDKTLNSVTILADRENYHSPAWEIVVKTINSDLELEQFLKNRYGEGCKLGEKKPFAQEGVFDIMIEGDGLDLGETKCPLNYMTKVLYSPTRKKLAAWDIGQACGFAYPTFDKCLDMEMVDSFRFE